MTEPGAGADVRRMQWATRLGGDDWIVNGTKQFISKAGLADFIIVFIATDEEETAHVNDCFGNQQDMRRSVLRVEGDAEALDADNG